MDFREVMNTTAYDFLRSDPHLGDRIILLGVSGSYGYGTNREGSDMLRLNIIWENCMKTRLYTKGTRCSRS